VPLRWSDGSARYAVVSAVLPSAVANGASLTLGFANQAAPSGSRTVAQLLSDFPDFDARLTLTSGGVTRTVSAREMLSANLYQWVAQGPQRYGVVVADHTDRSRDFGFDGTHKPLRPMFHIDFWPSIHKVRVRAVVESPNLDALQDVGYDVTLSQGKASPATVWSKSGVAHHFGTRWSKTFWVGGEPSPKVDIKHDVSQWAKSGLVPNLETDTSALTAAADEWYYGSSSGFKGYANLAHDIYDTGGLWNPGLSHLTDSIGHMPAWASAWLKTGEYALRQLTLATADLADAWPAHFREHDSVVVLSTGPGNWCRPKASACRSTPTRICGSPTTTAATAPALAPRCLGAGTCTTATSLSPMPRPTC